MTQKQTYAPTHEVFHVVGEGEQSRWTKVGVAWSHKDNEGLNLAINYSPLVEGKTVIRKIKPKTDTKKAAKK